MPTTRFPRLKRVALRYGILYFLVVIVLSGCSDRLLLFPSREDLSNEGGKRLVIAGPAGPLEIWTMRTGGPRAEPQAYVLHFIGNASRAEYEVIDTAELWGRTRPVEVWVVNYPGYGGSAGSARLASIAPAALAAYDAIKQQAGNRPIFLSGLSIGTTAALHVAAHRPVSGVVLRNPPPLRQLIIGNYGWWNLWLAAIPVSLHVPADLDSIANAKKCTAPAVFIVGGLDTVVPPKFHRMVIDAYAGPKQVVRFPNAGHNDPIAGADYDQASAALDQLWAQTVAPPATAGKR